MSYLAGKFARELQKQRPELVTDKDVYCIMMAGLCHDLGKNDFTAIFKFKTSKNSHPIINILPKVSKIKIVDLFILFLKATVHGLTFGRVSSGP